MPYTSNSRSERGSSDKNSTRCRFGIQQVCSAVKCMPLSEGTGSKVGDLRCAMHASVVGTVRPPLPSPLMPILNPWYVGVVV